MASLFLFNNVQFDKSIIDCTDIESATNFFFSVTGLLSSAILQKLSRDADEVEEHSLSISLREHSRLTNQYICVFN